MDEQRSSNRSLSPTTATNVIPWSLSILFPLPPAFHKKRWFLQNIYLHGPTVISYTHHRSTQQELRCVLLPLIPHLSKYTCFHIKRAAVTSWQCVCLCVCVCFCLCVRMRGMGASTAKAKQNKLH